MMGLVQSQKPERKGIVEKPAMFKGDNSDNARLFRNVFVVYMSDNEKYFARDQQGHVLRDANGVPIIDNPKAIKSALSDRKSTRLNSSHSGESRMPSSA